MSDSIRELTELVRAFAHARDWEHFHTPKNLAMALIVEVAELVEQFQWLTAQEAFDRTRDPETRAAVADEMADVAIYLIRLADVAEVDLGAAVAAKMKLNNERFPATTAEAD